MMFLIIILHIEKLFWRVVNAVMQLLFYIIIVHLVHDLYDIHNDFSVYV